MTVVDFSKFKVKVKNPKPTSEEGLAALIALGACTVTGIVMLANIPPYSRAIGELLSRSLGWKVPALTWIVGTLAFAAIQSAEVRPIFIFRGDRERVDRAEQIAAIAYLIDAVLGLCFWPPLTVSFSQFVAAPNITNINILNILILFVTLYGCELCCKLVRNLR